MLVRRRQGLEVLSISALDLFASALGVFILITVLMFPYYLRQPSLEVELQGAKAGLSAAGQSVWDAEQTAADAARQKDDAEAALARARARLEAAQRASAAAREHGQTDMQTLAVRTERGSPGRHAAALTITDLDVVFVMDTTGSMRDELRDVQASLLAIVRVLHRLAPTLRVGFVAYRDRDQKYITRSMRLRPMENAALDQMLSFVRGLRAHGGGDRPEAVDEALRAALAMDWRSDAQGRIVVVGDAPAHAANWQSTFELAAAFQQSAAERGFPRAVSAIFTGHEPGAKTFFARVAEAGGGDFTVHQGQMIESVLVSVLRDPDQVLGRP